MLAWCTCDDRHHLALGVRIIFRKAARLSWKLELSLLLFSFPCDCTWRTKVDPCWQPFGNRLEGTSLAFSSKNIHDVRHDVFCMSCGKIFCWAYLVSVIQRDLYWVPPVPNANRVVWSFFRVTFTSFDRNELNLRGQKSRFGGYTLY